MKTHSTVSNVSSVPIGARVVGAPKVEGVPQAEPVLAHWRSSRRVRLMALYLTMVAVSTCAIYFLEHVTLVNAFRTALVAAIGKTLAAHWVTGFFDVRPAQVVVDEEQEPEQSDARRVVFLWDGTQKMVDAAVRQAKEQMSECQTLHAIHAMPHESVYSMGEFGGGDGREPLAIAELRKQFRHQVRKHTCLKRSGLNILFGERIREIGSYTRIVKADLLIAAPFKQSSFSKWIFGDLNERLINETDVDVMFVDVNKKVEPVEQSESIEDQAAEKVYPTAREIFTSVTSSQNQP